MVKLLSIIVFSVVVILSGAYLFFNRQFENKVERTKFQVQEEIREIVEPIVNSSPTLPPSASAKVLSGGTHSFQTFNNCGPASLSMALSYYGIKVSQHELGDRLRPYQVASGDNDDKSVTLPEMANVAEEYGFAAYYRPNGNIELIKNFINLGIPVVTRTWTKPGEDIGHYRVVKGYDSLAKTLIQDDSLQGKNLTYKEEDFYSLWDAFNYEYLVLVPKDKIDEAKLVLGENLDEANAWERALSSDTNDFNKLVALYRLGRYKEAVEIYERIEDTLPRRMLWYQIEPILAYQKIGNYAKVFEITDYLIGNGNRAFSEAYQIRGEVYEAQGNKDAAKAEFEKVIMYNKNFYKYWK